MDIYTRETNISIYETTNGIKQKEKQMSITWKQKYNAFESDLNAIGFDKLIDKWIAADDIEATEIIYVAGCYAEEKVLTHLQKQRYN